MTRDTWATIGHWAALLLACALCALLAGIAVGQELTTARRDAGSASSVGGRATRPAVTIHAPVGAEGDESHALRTTTTPAASGRGRDHGDDRATDAGSGTGEHSAEADAQEPGADQARGAAGSHRAAAGDPASVSLELTPPLPPDGMVASLEWTLARCFWAEAGPKSEADHWAIAYALLAYCHGLRGGAARVDRESAADPRAWAFVMVTAEMFLNSAMGSNPCPGATDWGGYDEGVDKARIDAGLAAGRIVRVHCKRPTLNHFFREVRP